MAIKALDISKVRDHIFSGDDPDDPTIWKLGTLSARDKGAIQDSMTSYSFTDDDIARAQARKEGKTPEVSDEDEGEITLDTKISRSKMNWEAVRRGLKGWENFLDAEGKPITFKTISRDVGGGVKREVVPNKLLDLIPYEVMAELAETLLKEIGDEDDAKNSQEPSTGGSSTETETAESAE